MEERKNGRTEGVDTTDHIMYLQASPPALQGIKRPWHRPYINARTVVKVTQSFGCLLLASF